MCKNRLYKTLLKVDSFRKKRLEYYRLQTGRRRHFKTGFFYLACVRRFEILRTVKNVRRRIEDTNDLSTITTPITDVRALYVPRISLA